MAEGFERRIDFGARMALGTTSVIRCRDCKYWQDEEEGIIEMPICQRFMPEFTHKKDKFFFRATADDFCSFAVRKE